MPTIHDAVAHLRKRYSSYTRAQLITVIHIWKTFDPHYIAAKSFLDEMDAAASDQKHRESLNESRHANKLAKRAIFIASLSLLAFVADFSYKYFFSQSNTYLPISQEAPKKELHSSPSISSSSPMSGLSKQSSKKRK